MGEDWEKRSGYANPNLLITMATVPNAGAVGIVSALISSKNNGRAISLPARSVFRDYEE